MIFLVDEFFKNVYHLLCIRTLIAELDTFHKLSTLLNEILYENYLALLIRV